MAAQASHARTGRGLAPTWLAIAIGALVTVLTIAGLVAIALAHQSEGQLIRLLNVLSGVALGTLVASRRPGNPLGWLMLSASLFLSVGDDAAAYTVLDYRLHGGRLPLGRLALALQPSFLLGLVLITGSLWLYPDERLPAGRWRPVAWFLSAAGLAYGLVVFVPWVVAALARQVRVDATGTPVDIDQGAAGLIWQLTLLGVLGMLVCWAVWLAVQVPKYRRSSGERRLQLKWLYSGGVVFVVSLAVTVLQPGSTSLAWGIITGVAAAGLAALPVTLGIGILKFRLYDIDRIISRTLSYALVTGLIIGVYAGTVLLATHALPLSGPVSVAAATLIAAVLFNPLRRRIQHVVDRRFNRAHYDAEATMAAFASRLRESVELASVQQKLTAAVQQAVEPVHVSVWLARPSASRD
ncbi:MAG TPA: hypothetical protein VKU77_05495 [Streptosporangiaceae bacterium]|nr:hypothetical protein [Streptosporangiaceae bacterium]